jgi:hypothetical protein
MEMAANEFNIFVFNLKNLWRSGQEATLNVKSKAGNAWVELGACLGHPLDLSPPHLHRDDHEENSRYRRRHRRSAERQNKETEESIENDNTVENDDKGLKRILRMKLRLLQNSWIRTKTKKMLTKKETVLPNKTVMTM